MGTLFVRQIVLLMRKKMVKENSQGAKVDDFKFWIQLLSRKRKKKKRHKHFISLPSILFLFVLYCLKAGEPVVQSQVLIHSSFFLRSFPSPTSLSELNNCRGEGWGKFEHLGKLLLWLMSFLSLLFPFYGTQICKICFSCFSRSYLSLSEINNRGGEGVGKVWIPR